MEKNKIDIKENYIYRLDIINTIQIIAVIVAISLFKVVNQVFAADD